MHLNARAQFAKEVLFLNSFNDLVYGEVRSIGVLPM
jgi:hypothetical protein